MGAVRITPPQPLLSLIGLLDGAAPTVTEGREAGRARRPSVSHHVAAREAAFGFPSARRTPLGSEPIEIRLPNLVHDARPRWSRGPSLRA